MNANLSRPSNLAYVLVFITCFLGSFCYGQLGMSTKTLSTKKATNETITYQLNLINPETSISHIQEVFLGKTGIYSCLPGTELNSLLITTSTDITHIMVIGVARTAGCENTYRRYKEEIQAKTPSRTPGREVR